MLTYLFYPLSNPDSPGRFIAKVLHFFLFSNIKLLFFSFYTLLVENKEHFLCGCKLLVLYCTYNLKGVFL